MESIKELKDRYCKENGYSSFNKYNNNDYSMWLEDNLIKEQEVVKDYDLLHNVSNQRELLIAFGLKVATQCTKDGNWTVDIKEFAKEFESNL